MVVNLKDWEITDTKPAFLTGWVKREAINQYRRNEIDEADFQKQVFFTFTHPDSNISTDILVMNEILNRSLNTASFHWQPASGIYLDGLGALFFLWRIVKKHQEQEVNEAENRGSEERVKREERKVRKGEEHSNFYRASPVHHRFVQR